MTQFQLFAIEDAGPKTLSVSESAAQFPDLYRGLPLGVYDVFHTFEHNKFLYLNRHLARTERSMALLGWNYLLDRARLLRALHGIVTAAEWPEMRVRIDILAAPANVTAASVAAAPVGSLNTAARELIAIQPFTPPPPELYERGVAVDFAAGLTRDNPRAKTAEFAARRPASAGLAQLESADTRSQTTDDGPQTRDAGQQTTEDERRAEDNPLAAVSGLSSVVVPYEYLLLDAAGRILEGTGTNFWAVRDGVIYTAEEGVLEGITREIILALIKELGIPLRLEAVSVEDIPALDEAALSGSSRAFLPVVSIAGQTVGDGRPGPITRRILAAYNAFVMENIQTAI
jgi:branched-subunit amino acid aminotransferase/4-amino-4-deoxychorismate lyase